MTTGSPEGVTQLFRQPSIRPVLMLSFALSFLFGTTPRIRRGRHDDNVIGLRDGKSGRHFIARPPKKTCHPEAKRGMSSYYYGRHFNFERSEKSCISLPPI